MAPDESATVSMCRRGSADPGSDLRRTVVWVRGEHDIATRAHLSVAFAQAAGLDGTDVVVDLSDVTFMDGSTIGAIVEAYNRLRARSRSLSVRAPSTRARRLLEVCKLAFLIEGDPAPSSAAALDSWVAVPASDRASTSSPLPDGQEAHSQEPDHPAASRHVEPAGSIPQRRQRW